MSKPPTFSALKYFKYEHLPEYLQVVSKPFCDVARIVADTPTNDPAETATALRKLLEAKDCAVRAAVKPT